MVGMGTLWLKMGLHLTTDITLLYELMILGYTYIGSLGR
jgi:hypothetical protein